MAKEIVIANKLREALSLVREDLSETQVDDITTLISAGEWGLALETLGDVLYEDDLPVPAKAYRLLEEAGTMMEMDSQNWEILKSLVVD